MARVPRTHRRLLGVLIGCCVCFATLVLILRIDMPRLVTSRASFKLLVARTPKERAKGLGGRNSLAQNEGMLFIYKHAGKECFWMKGMKFDLDILWLDVQKKIVHLEQGVSPRTYPALFCPDTPAQYVVELNSGTASRNGLSLGATVKIENLPSPTPQAPLD